MSGVKERETARSKLSRNDLTELEAWFAEFTPDAWDRQLEQDAGNGRLDAFYQRLWRENEGEPDLLLNDILNKEKLPWPVSKVAA